MYLALALVLVLAAAAWLVRLRYWPYGPCRACEGRRGRGIGSSRQAWSHCQKCRGSGERLRPGARLWARNRELDRRKP